MAWQSEYPFYYVHASADDTPGGPLRVNEQCFIRKEHKCGKIFGASKSCFIACPTDDDLGTVLDLMAEKLMRIGVEPIIAVKERAYGQDIFCTKICGKIIESRFCLVILDDSPRGNQSIPNPNVYYEYGLMTAMRKHIVPLQKDGLTLAFNIQSYDTIKYSTKNMASELDRAFRDAIRMTEAKERDVGEAGLTDRTLLRRFELSDMVVRDRDWFLFDAISDTGFKGFGHYAHRFYAYVGKIDEATEFRTYLEDTDIALHRTEKKYEELVHKVSSLKNKSEQCATEIKKQKEQAAQRGIRVASYEQVSLERELREAASQIDDLEGKLALMDRVFIAFILNPQLRSADFSKRIKKVLGQYKRYHLVISSENAITFGEVKVRLKSASV